MATNKMDLGRALYRNPLSFLGLGIIAVSASLICLTFLLEFSLKDPSPYIGVFTYLVFPAGLLVGLILFLFGLRRESLRRRRLGTSEALPYPRLDLNDPRQRRNFVAISSAASLLGILLVFVGYNGFLFTESVTFCGEICHTVMEPEYTSYKASPHARVPCVDCHVGSGASWYVRSKLSGVRQVFATLFESYERPIPVPIENLRPARETCEACHWPEKFYGSKYIQYPHFRYDETNTPEQISLVIHTGGGSPMLGGVGEGIHSAMIINNDIFYRPTDQSLQHIVAIRVRSRKDGSERLYISKDFGLDEAAILALPERQLDCMDCHNRPTHIFPAPDVAVDRALAMGLISRELPWIKKVAVDALTRDYPDREAARVGIRREVLGFYEERYPDIVKTAKQDLDRAVEVLLRIHEHSVFSGMRVDWKTYPMNNTHRNWPGCFRCHDGRHLLVWCSGQCDKEKPLTRDCNTCHTAPRRGPLMPVGSEGGSSAEDWHRWRLEGRHAEIRCDRCHAAGFRPPLDCAECHRIDRQAPMMEDMQCVDCHKSPGLRRPVEDCASCHDRIGGLHAASAHSSTPCISCHKPHKWSAGGRAICLSCHTTLSDHPKGGGDCAACHDFTAAAKGQED